MNIKLILAIAALLLTYIGTLKLKEIAGKYRPLATSIYQKTEQKLRSMADDNYDAWWEHMRKLSIALISIGMIIAVITNNGDVPHPASVFFTLVGIAIMTALVALKEWKNILMYILKMGFGSILFVCFATLCLAVYLYFSVNYSEYAEITGQQLAFFDLVTPLVEPVWKLAIGTLGLAALTVIGLLMLFGMLMAFKYTRLVFKEIFPNHIGKNLIHFSGLACGLAAAFIYLR